jgi:Glycosyltransferase family 87
MASKVREPSERVNEVAGGCGRVRLSGLLRMVWVWSAALFWLALAVGWVEYRLGAPLWHYNPLGNPRHEDLLVFLPLYRLLHTAAFYDGVSGARVAYPPLGAVLYAVIYGTGHPVGFYRGVAAFWLLAGAWGVQRKLHEYGFGWMTTTLFPVTLVVVSFPIVGLLQQGNIELFMWISAGVGTWLFLRGHDDAAAVLWGLAAAVKLYPVILLSLLLPRGRWRAFGVGVATFIGATVLSLAWLGPTIGVAWHGLMQSVFGYQGMRVSELTWHELAANHSVIGLVKFMATVTGISMATLTLPYYACGAVMMGLAFFGRLWKMPAANQLLAVTSFMVMFPPISYFYTLVHLYPPFLLLLFLGIRAEQEGLSVPGLRGTVMLFVPIFAPFTLFTYPQADLYGGLIQAFLLIMLFGCALEYPFAMRGRVWPMADAPAR